MKKIITIAVAAVMALGVTAAPASAETLYRNGSNKVTIKPWFPGTDGIEIIKERVTVKKGKKTVAKNKKFYKAKKGKYKVTSTMWYRTATDRWVEGTTTTIPGVTKSVSASDLYLGRCTVTSRTFVQDNSVYKGSDSFGWWLAGDVWVDYTATCAASYYDDDYNVRNVTVGVKWNESDYVFVDPVTGDKATDLAANDDFYYVGQYTDSVYNFSLLTPVSYVTAPTTTTSPGYWVTDYGTEIYTWKYTRTVKVK